MNRTGGSATCSLTAAPDEQAFCGKVSKKSKMRPFLMTAPKLRSVTLSSKGQITLSSKARQQLGLAPGATLMEIVVGNCVILMPENRLLSDAMRIAQQSLQESGVSIDELNLEIERLKAERFAKEYPDLAS
jgi:bifunctional DNA-binding transcriptional regulator/antitoxin component of YhaV-PrlF toxin-antitoxin module